MAAVDADPRAILTRPFPPGKVKTKRGQGQRMMSYISHGLVTERLNEADPQWSSEMVAEHTYLDPNGVLHCAGVTIRLTVNGVSRVESGGPQRQDGFTNEIKNAYSDALKRAAMRFGVALAMWESLIDAEFDEDANPDDEPRTAPVRKTMNGQPSNVGGAPYVSPEAETIDEKGMKYLHAIGKEVGLDHDALHARALMDFKVASLAQLTRAQARQLVDAIKPRTDSA